ncbi:DNA glycosylase AlkZ-like family protein [Pseudonocardia acidicola]|uniref:Winged helix DNA-binding domain-containing protein n=1 Tax=Pseudonocardia acidicola TaxID=2724939 RepID=A0ABX1S7Y3_9PSEU|nr:crosslink repair DNA glycosylase YcaQ family protein [Pseudonocardia acidicola]NMH96364.1 winged helix DNA-binding domain-containing protein [Pseudonocardia acidicola]
MAGAVRRVGVAGRRARLTVRHRLCPTAWAADSVAGATAVAASLVALHATDAASVFLSVLARTRDGRVGTVERALYDDRALIRMLGMRRTVWVLDRDVAPIVQAACARAVAATQRKRLVAHLADSGVDEAAAWLADVEAATHAALAARGEAAATELAADEPRLRTRIAATGQNATARVLLQLAADGHIVRGRPRGSWTSTRYRWSPMTTWLGAPLAELAVEAAQIALAGHWLATFGPAPVSDLRWWAGWGIRETSRALAALDTVEVDLEGTPGLMLAEDADPVPAPEPAAALLPALDPTPMGWQERSWFLGPHGPALFDRTGNIGPTVWWDGRIVGGWAQRPDGEVAVRLLDDIGADGEKAVQAGAERLAGHLGEVRVTPRFRTPLERELST